MRLIDSDSQMGIFLERYVKSFTVDVLDQVVREIPEYISEKNSINGKLIEDLKYYLDINEENGVVYIPKFIIEKIINNGYGE